ncbi:MAG TPA: hypothetical protein VN688_08890 [Gemmataceae bacterium]|nr:hypothetical protein [Gemmataceae bacterium]
MRVSSLSDARVIGLLTKYFVPAWVSRDAYQLEPRSEAERAELERIDHERSKRKLEGGTVCVFVLDADGGVLATQRVQRAYKPENLIPFLEKIIADKHLKPRAAESIRASTAVPAMVKPKTEDGRFVHVWTRCDQAGTNRGLSQDRVELTAAECQAFMPAAGARPGDSWKLPDAIARKLFQYCYPPLPHWKAADCKVLAGTLKATLIAASAEETRIKLEGEMKLSFPHTGKPTDGRITAQFVGSAHADARKHTLTSLMLVSAQAEHVWFWQGKPQPIKMRIALELEP